MTFLDIALFPYPHTRTPQVHVLERSIQAAHEEVRLGRCERLGHLEPLPRDVIESSALPVQANPFPERVRNDRFLDSEVEVIRIK